MHRLPTHRLTRLLSASAGRLVAVPPAVLSSVVAASWPSRLRLRVGSSAVAAGRALLRRHTRLRSAGHSTPNNRKMKATAAAALPGAAAAATAASGAAAARSPLAAHRVLPPAAAAVNAASAATSLTRAAEAPTTTTLATTPSAASAAASAARATATASAAASAASAAATAEPAAARSSGRNPLPAVTALAKSVISRSLERSKQTHPYQLSLAQGQVVADPQLLWRASVAMMLSRAIYITKLMRRQEISTQVPGLADQALRYRIEAFQPASGSK